MSGFEQLKNTFFDETSELLVGLESGLTELRDGTGTEDSVHAIFRAVHSIKGGAGVFGFSELIEFAHVFETVLDAVRRGSLAITPEVVDVLFRANDTLADLVGMAREGASVPQGFGNDSRAALDLLMQGDAGAAGGSKADEQPAPAELEGISFVPVRVDDVDSSGSDFRHYSIRFKPKPELIKKGIDPSFFLNTLRSMGELDVVAETDAVPTIEHLQHGNAYIAWICSLRSTSPSEDIDAVFAPIVQDCELTISDLTSAPFVEPLPVVAAPQEVEASAESSALELLAPRPAEPLPAVPTSAGANSAAPMVSAPAQVSPTVSAAPAAALPAAASPAAAPPAATSSDARAANAKQAGTTIRVELEKIDRVVNMVGELVIAQAMLGQVIEDLPEEISGRVSNILADLIRHTRGLKDSVMAIRAQPVSSVFQRMPRLVRELSIKTGKKVQVEMFGETTEVDKTIIERLSDPLTHIIRNSIDHGIEAPADRIARGKNEMGTIRLAADQRGGRIVIEISDDGAGINCERVLKKARERGLVDLNATLTDDEICNLIFLPGFSTAETVSDISGRGVGMDVVRRNIQDLGGRTSIKSDPGRGMTIQLALPLTLAVMDGMVVEVSNQTYVLPIPNIVECLRPTRGEVHHLLGTAGTLQLRGEIVPLVHLGELLSVGATIRDTTEGVVIITEASDGTRLGFIVDELCGHQQVVIKSIEENCGTVHGIAGATILGDGHVAFILDVEMLSDMTCSEGRHSGAAAQHSGTVAPARLN